MSRRELIIVIASLVAVELALHALEFKYLPAQGLSAVDLLSQCFDQNGLVRIRTSSDGEEILTCTVTHDFREYPEGENDD